MALQQILGNLIAEVEDAIGAAFVDDGGETVDIVCAGLTPYKMKIIAAYFGIYVKKVLKMSEESLLGTPKVIIVDEGNVRVYVAFLPDEYFLLLIQRRPAIQARAKEALTNAVKEIKEEFF